MDNKYIDVVPDQPVDESFNHVARELDVPDFPQGKQHVVKTKVTVADENGNLCEKEVGTSQGRLSPNPGYGEDGETKDATKTKLVKGEVHVDGGEFVNQRGIRVQREPVNYIGGLFVKGKPVNPEEGSDDSNVYRFAVGEVMTEEIAGLLKSGDVLLVNNMAFVINKINSDHAWFRGFFTDGSVEGKVSVALLNWEDTGTKKLTITWNEVSKGLEVIEWDGARNFTQEEFNKLAQNKACVMLIEQEETDFSYYYVAYTSLDSPYSSVSLCRFIVNDEGLGSGTASSLIINEDGTFSTYDYDFSDLTGTKLYKHVYSFGAASLTIISTKSTKLTNDDDDKILSGRGGILVDGIPTTAVLTSISGAGPSIVANVLTESGYKSATLSNIEPTITEL